jgi:phosphohistidine phosphatase SixA
VKSALCACRGFAQHFTYYVKRRQRQWAPALAAIRDLGTVRPIFPPRLFAAMNDASRSLTRRRALGRFAAAFTLLFMSGAAEPAAAASVARSALVAALKQGGHVLVFRHADSPAKLPDAKNAERDNPKHERQLSAAGKEGATKLGAALKRLGIPVGEVLVSPAYRAQQTARLAQLTNARIQDELTFEGTAMTETVTPAQAAWLKARAAVAPKTGNTFIVTHSPNLAAAFPAITPALAAGEAAVFAPDGQGGTKLLGRLKIEDWAGL